jgi:hypothetical protein
VLDRRPVRLNPVRGAPLNSPSVTMPRLPNIIISVEHA